eukprot:gnl/TRDRNA2_/TRDRNA2_134790_c0_seq1.p1 gnl/TRDRNA2_/TRDRNA2_134790_c0~~gnl/TRDRNA2_/TRDRNA2_134790_c0_seq1.p1  ORF type:complete len:247 (-),score=33.87 gnl/TRDRNA2_/TRDRNA2_134790_c0_seq1:11-751(-)
MTRTSSSTFVEGDQSRGNPVVQGVLRRAADLAGVPRSWVRDGSALQLLRYRTGEFYGGHYDSRPLSWYADCRAAFQSAVAARGSGWDAWAPVRASCPRLATIFLYLNDVPKGAGGETCFPMADDEVLMRLSERQWDSLTARDDFLVNATRRCIFRNSQAILAAPRQGDALLWYNHLPAPTVPPKELRPGRAAWGVGIGERDSFAVHVGLKVDPDDTVKYASNLWLALPWWSGDVEVPQMLSLDDEL